jgi:hypothetical protein
MTPVVIDNFPIQNGLKQGDALSPILFNFALEQRFSNFFEVGTTFVSQNSSADHRTLVPFESKFVIF